MLARTRAHVVPTRAAVATNGHPDLAHAGDHAGVDHGRAAGGLPRRDLGAARTPEHCYAAHARGHATAAEAAQQVSRCARRRSRSARPSGRPRAAHAAPAEDGRSQPQPAAPRQSVFQLALATAVLAVAALAAALANLAVTLRGRRAVQDRIAPHRGRPQNPARGGARGSTCPGRGRTATAKRAVRAALALGLTRPEPARGSARSKALLGELRRAGRFNIASSHSWEGPRHRGSVCTVWFRSLHVRARGNSKDTSRNTQLRSPACATTSDTRGYPFHIDSSALRHSPGAIVPPSAPVQSATSASSAACWPSCAARWIAW